MNAKGRFVVELKKTACAGVDWEFVGLEDLGFFTDSVLTRFLGSVPGGFYAVRTTPTTKQW